jgi:hypothetical protein
MLKHIKWRKMIPLVILVGLAILAGGTDVFSAAIRTQVIEVASWFRLRRAFLLVWCSCVWRTFSTTRSKPVWRKRWH